jgi:hypothetical protein
MVRRALSVSCCVAVAILAAACSPSDRSPLPSPSAPTPLPPAVTSYTGAWHGTFTITQCTGRRHCNESIGQRSAFSLLLQQGGAHVDGVFQAEGFAIPVGGNVSTDGQLSLTGSRPSPGLYSPAAELTRFTARQSPDGLTAELAYRVRYREDMPENGNALEQTIAATVPSAARGEATPVNSFAGRWVGSLIIADCSTEGWTFCYPEERGREYGYELTLTQSGQRVTGQLNFRGRFDVTGSVAGDTLTLERSVREDAQSGGRYFANLEHWIMTRDAVGQLRGEMLYHRDMVWDASLQRPPYISRYRGEIVYGILEP